MNTQTLLSQACQKVARLKPLWSQGLSGNVSIKDADQIWSKSPGFRFDQVSDTKGVSKTSKSTAGSDIAAVMPKNFVAQISSIASMLISYEHSQNATRVLEWFDEQNLEDDLVFVAENLSGESLAKRLASETHRRFVLLKNQGVIIQGNSAEILERWKKIESKFCFDFNYPLLQHLMNSENTLSATRNLLNTEPAMPMKFYFPEAVQFQSRLQGVLEETENGFLLRAGAWSQDSDACEIWSALQLINKLQPKMPELAR
jgi:hypothetical protein